MADTVLPSRDIARLIEIMAALRTPVTGCPWDLEQTFETIAPYTIEEAYEVADAIQRSDLNDLKDELGDLLLQVVYHARIAEEQNAFAFGDVVDGITAKMIRRHPHVFGDAHAKNAGAVKGLWDKIKADERAEKALSLAQGDAASPSTPQGGATKNGVLADVPLALPALTRAIKLQNKAAKVGFDWPDLAPVFNKMREELAELEDALASSIAASDSPAASGRLAGGESEAAIEEEFGDLLFVMANVARHLKLDPEASLRLANDKFSRRFAHIEARLGEKGLALAQATLQDMDALWDEAKALERKC